METISTKRSLKLIANFINGYAEWWHMAVKESFKNELDIQYQKRTKDKIEYYEWTQGMYYRFSEGQVFYDSIEGYSDWNNALANVNLVCQIVDAQPNIPEKQLNDITGKNEFKIKEGIVKFVLFKPNSERKQLIGYVCYNLTQNQFVHFLRTGDLNQ